MADDYDGRKYYVTSNSLILNATHSTDQRALGEIIQVEESDSDASVKFFLLLSTDIVFCLFATIMNHQLTGFVRWTFCSLSFWRRIEDKLVVTPIVTYINQKQPTNRLHMCVTEQSLQINKFKRLFSLQRRFSFQRAFSIVFHALCFISFNFLQNVIFFAII